MLSILRSLTEKFMEGMPQDRGGLMLTRVCTTVCFAALVSTMSIFVDGLPILGPDLSSCVPVIPSSGTSADAVECCVIDNGASIKDFKFNLNLPMRVRRPTHKVDVDYVRKYERAVGLMKALPPGDPRSFEGQWRLHCAYTRAYNQFNSTEFFDVHTNWLVIPFHRWFLYFHELILASLIGDDTFAIPYWAWDLQGENNPPANIMPPIYTKKNSSLYDENRSKAHQDHGRVDLDFSLGSPKQKDPEVLLQDNLYTMWRTMIGDVKTPEDFYGGKLSWGEPPEAGLGVFASGPHLSVHTWVGDETCPNGEDMAPPYSAARDPIFFAHHAQLDRLWLMWKSWGGKDFSDPDWLGTEFLFYDENADLVRVNLRDSLNNDNFRVTYEQVDPEWLDYTPRSIRAIDLKYAKAGRLSQIWRNVVEPETYRTIAMAVGGYFQIRKKSPEVSLGGLWRAVRTSRVSRPKVLRSSSAPSVYDEVLVITGVVEKPFDVNVVFNIFLELPEADENTPHHCVEFLGSVKAESEGLAVGVDPTVARKFTKTTSIRERLQILDRVRQKSVTVTFVPAWDPKDDSDVSIRVTDLKVEMKLAR